MQATFTSASKALRQVGGAGLFLLRILGAIRPSLRQQTETMRQIYFLGVRSLVIIMTCAFFVGMVLTLQGYTTLTRFGATDAVGTVLALSLFRELGPVLTALLFAGRGGTSVAAEIGLMKATDQISAMDLMAVDPVEHVVVPRFLAGIIVVPALTMLFNLVALTGGSLLAANFLGVDNGMFWSNLQSGVAFANDFTSSLIKSAVFGVTVSLISVYCGYISEPTGEGMGRATTQAVVYSSVLVLLFDFILTAFLF